MRSILLLGAAMGLMSLGAPQARPFDVLALSALCSNEAQGSAGVRPAAATMKILPGYGNDSLAISTGNPQAQAWFNHGLRLAWAFAHEEATAAFREAVRLDPACGMCLWGEALSLGPTINYPINAQQKAEAYAVAVRAQKLLASSPERDRRLGSALIQRYRLGGGAYARAMETLARGYPQDDSLQVLAADALMIAGQEKRAVEILDAVLRRSPDSAGAIHFYIHSTEWIGQAGRAEAHADRLKALAPGASHLIHMPSHTYYQIGRYRDAAMANLEAMDVDHAWVKTTGASASPWDIPYYGHNVRFALGGAMMAGEAGAALKIAGRYLETPEKDIKAGGIWAQTGVASAWFAHGRFTDPDQVMAMAPPSPDLPLVRALWRYGRGEALARKGDADLLLAEVRLMKPGVEGRGPPSGSATALIEIGRGVLAGRAAMLQSDFGVAAKAYRAAAIRQERALGDQRDPPPWWYPVRRSLAAALLADSRYEPALQEARSVLKTWPRDPMALLVVSRAQAALGRRVEAEEALAAARSGWGAGDIAVTPLTLI
ncbi:MAG: tetratricopeptide repeat protein [Caulobacter sp.]|nr:tetratricopeptide repeat protein [Caulobacter sp.]